MGGGGWGVGGGGVGGGGVEEQEKHVQGTVRPQACVSAVAAPSELSRLRR